MRGGLAPDLSAPAVEVGEIALGGLGTNLAKNAAMAGIRPANLGMVVLLTSVVACSANLPTHGQGSDGPSGPATDAGLLGADGQAATDADVAPDANPAAPIVGAGADQDFDLPTTTTSLLATASSPTGATLTYQWILADGTGAQISSTGALATDISNLALGSYTFQFTATDSANLSASAVVHIVVHPVGTFFVDATAGNDVNAGTDSDHAWQSVAHINSTALSPGNSVLFKRGQTFSGGIVTTSSGASGNPITYGAYGVSGAKPILSGFSTMSTWAADADHPGVYVSACTWCGSLVNVVAVNGATQYMGRYPNLDTDNGGYLTYESTSPAATNSTGTYTGYPTMPTSITDDQLAESPDWTGAELVVRKLDYVIERRTITGQTGGTLTYVEPMGRDLYYGGLPGWGYFIQNDVRTLDEVGEWYFAPSQGSGQAAQLSMYFGANGPAGTTVQVGVVDTLISVGNQHDLVFTDLSVRGANGIAVQLSSSTNVTLERLDITLSGVDAIDASGTTGLTVDGCAISDSNSTGIRVAHSTTTALTNNVVRRTGVYPGQGAGAGNDGGYTGITIGNYSIAMPNTVVSGNIVDTVGYHGIAFFSNDITIKNNFVTNVTTIEDDGGGIYTYVGSGTPYNHVAVVDNIVTNTPGAPLGKATPTRYGSCIYMDGNTSNITITGNTTANCADTGFQSNNNKNMDIEFNTFVGDGSSLAHFSTPAAWGPPTMNVTMEHNLFVAKSPTQLVYAIDADSEAQVAGFGTFDYNDYVRPLDDGLLFHETVAGTVANDFSRASWAARYSFDTHSQGSPVAVAPYTATLTSGNLLQNSDFSAGSTHWFTYSGANNMTPSWDNTSLTMSFSSPSANHRTYSSVYQTVGTAAAGDSYIMRVSTTGTSPYGIVAGSMQETSQPYKQVVANTYQSFDATTSTHEFLLSNLSDPTVGETAGAANYGAVTPVVAINDNSGTTSVDNFEVYKATATITDPNDAVRLVYNATSAPSTTVLDGNFQVMSYDGTSMTSNLRAAGYSLVLPPFRSAVLIKQ